MAKLQMFTALGTPVQPLQFFLSQCSLRISISSSAPSSPTREQLPVFFVAAAASSAGGDASSNESSIKRALASHSGSRRSTTTERGLSRDSRLLEKEAPVAVDSTRASETPQSPRSIFEAQVKAGRLECCSRGCRPIFDGIKEDCCSTSVVVCDENWGDDEVSSLLEARAASYIERRTMRDLEIRHLCPDISFPIDFAEFVSHVWQDKSIATKYFEVAMKRNPNDANTLLRYAQFAWKTLGDLDKADELFARAIDESENDADVNAMYALFLWQTDD